MKLREVLEYWTLLIAPFMPHIAEEFWQKLGSKKYVKDAKFVSLAPFPAADGSKIDDSVEKGEGLVLSVREDIANILKLVKIEKPRKISLYVAPSWKRKVFSIVFRERAFDKSMKACMADAEIREKGGEVSRLVEKYVKNIGTLAESTMPEDDELASISDACGFLGREFGCEVSASRESEAPEAHSQKARNALPMKPSIFIE
jgi:leucyl-tRNA synthetase